jgi:hypothetical protein
MRRTMMISGMEATQRPQALRWDSFWSALLRSMMSSTSCQCSIARSLPFASRCGRISRSFQLFRKDVVFVLGARAGADVVLNNVSKSCRERARQNLSESAIFSSIAIGRTIKSTNNGHESANDERRHDNRRHAAGL